MISLLPLLRRLTICGSSNQRSEISGTLERRVGLTIAALVIEKPLPDLTIVFSNGWRMRPRGIALEILTHEEYDGDRRHRISTEDNNRRRMECGGPPPLSPRISEYEWLLGGRCLMAGLRGACLHKDGKKPPKAKAPTTAEGCGVESGRGRPHSIPPPPKVCASRGLGQRGGGPSSCWIAEVRTVSASGPTKEAVLLAALTGEAEAQAFFDRCAPGLELPEALDLAARLKIPPPEPLMPTGVEEGLTDQELADLLAWLIR